MIDFYSYDEIDKTGANYRVIYGERSNGKTFGYIVNHGFDNWYYRNEQFFYVRRIDEEIRPSKLNELWDTTALEYIKNLCLKRYPEYYDFYIDAVRGKFYLKGRVEKGKAEVIDIIGHYCCLTKAHTIKSVQFPRVTTIAFDEFLYSVATGTYIKDEFNRLINLVSTIKRRRTNLVVYLLGNTVNRNSELLTNMGINPRNINQGEIKVFAFKSVNEFGEKLENTVAVEHTRHFQSTADSEAFFVFGTPKEMMIRNGAWETDEYNTFTENQYYNDTIGRAFKLIHSNIALYCYIPCNATKIYLSSKRLSCSCEYITITTGDTFINRKTYNYKFNGHAIKRIKEILQYYFQNGKIVFDEFLTGDDFVAFMRECEIML